MNDKYEKILHMQRPQYIDLPPMPIEDRAAQFSPFAAVVGYDDAVDETARLTDSRIDLGEDEIIALNESLGKLRITLSERPTVKVTYFVPDQRKSGGKYVDKTGVVRRIDETGGVLVFTDAEKIRIDEIIRVEFADKSFVD